ncbi:MAG: Lsm family RNA-binding protein [Candidatus Heimdallarchaeota archaeon]|nr:Lsm family RNA-binding protein [Candidatus Heimdallarchaeota archaeon]MCK5049668.1 Lsm family RNA-binding protein [Candidatus Heimdallarchaeota archaeon]
MSSAASRGFMNELTIFQGKRVQVVMSNGKTYIGLLRALEPNRLNVILAEAICDAQQYHRVFLSGQNIIELTLADKPFDLEGLAEELANMFQPQNVKLFSEAGVIRVLDRFKISEDGVVGDGPVAERIRSIYDKFLAEKNE